MKATHFVVKDFLKTNFIAVENYSFKDDVAKIIHEMEKGLKGKSSISMLPTFIEDSGEIPREKKVLVLDAGGTNYRAAIVRFDSEKNPVITDFRKRTMPGFEREYKSDEFFDAITDFVEDIVQNVDTIGFCFSYAMEKTPQKDGRLIHFSKEIKAPEVEGQLIGEGVMRSLKRKKITHIKKIVLLNDTVATQLAGKAQDKEKCHGTYIGIILGTGVNACYNEKNNNILKEKRLTIGGSQIINTEAGSCRLIPYGKIDEEFRNITAKPETYHLEKMVSGGYLGKLWFFTIFKAAANGCFSESFSMAIKSIYTSGGIADFDASDLSKLLKDKQLPVKLKEFADEKDKSNSYEIGMELVKRAAYIASVLIVSIVKKNLTDGAEKKSVQLCIDGSTYWKLFSFKEMIEDHLKRELGFEGICYKIEKIENAPVIGAAVAGLTNH